MNRVFAKFIIEKNIKVHSCRHPARDYRAIVDFELYFCVIKDTLPLSYS